MFVNRGSFCLTGHISQGTETFLIVATRKGSFIGIYVVMEARDPAEYPRMHKTVPLVERIIQSQKSMRLRGLLKGFFKKIMI